MARSSPGWAAASLRPVDSYGMSMAFLHVPVRSARLLGVIAAALCFAVPAQAVVYYVRTSGSDTNNGTSRTTAFRTVQRALNAANPGDIVYVGGGTYTENLTTVRAGTNATTGQIQIIGSNTQTGDTGTITIAATGTNTALRVNHQFIRVASMTFRYGGDTVVWNAANGVMASCSVRDGSDDGLELLLGATLTTTGSNFLNAADHNVVVNSATLSATAGTMRSSRTTGAGIAIFGAGSVVTLNRVGIYANRMQGVLHQRGTLTMTNCRVFDNQAGGVRVEGFNSGTGPSPTVNTIVNIVNNTFDENTNAPAIWVRDAQYRIFNNCITTHATGVQITSTQTPTLNVNSGWGNNLYFGNSADVVGASADASDVFVDPGYTARANNNFTTTATSGGTDRGRNANSWTTVDFSNRVRPGNGVYDIGAYEVGGLVGTIPYFRDFETALTAEWSDTTRTNGGTNVTNYKGPHSVTGATSQSTSVWLRTTVGTSYTIFFDLIGLNTIDGATTTSGWGPDYFEVLVDGAVEWRETVAGGAGGNQSLLDTPEFFNSNFMIYRAIEVEFTAENTVTPITFFANCNQGWSDEGFGIDNLRVVTTATAAQFRHPYRDVAMGTPFAQQARGGGLHPADFNIDGRPDLIVLGQSPMLLSSSGVNAWTYSALNTNTYMPQGAIADADSNGVPDFLALRTNNDEHFFAARANAGVFAGFWQGTPTSLGATVSGNTAAVAAGDANADGLADFVISSSSSNQLALADAATIASGWTLSTFFPDGLPSFVPTQTGFPNSSADRGNGNRIASGDVNNDGRPDYFYLYNGGRLFMSQSDGTWLTTNRGIATSGNVLNASFADYDNDGDLDVFFGTTDGAQAMQLWRNPGGTGNFTNVASTAGLALTTRVTSSTWGDFDNDGDVDLYVIGNATQAQLYVNSGAPNYTFSVQERGVNTMSETADCAFFDYDLDGDLDLAVTNASVSSSYNNRLFENTPASNQNRYLLVRVRGRGAGGINSLAIGTRVELWDAANTTFLMRRDIGNSRGNGQDPLIAHFGGVNPATTYTLRVYRPTGDQYAVQVTPSTTTTTIGGRTFPQFYTFDEAAMQPLVEVVRWHEVGEDE
jgi:hypothetical protein